MNKEKFMIEMKHQLNEFENSKHISKEIRCDICIKILKLIIKYSTVVFYTNNNFFSEYRKVIKNKLYQLKFQKGFTKKEEVHKLCLHILKRYYGECLDENRCIAYKCDNTRCIQTIKKSNVCGIHLRYPTKIVKLLAIYLPVDISEKCVDLLF